MLITTALFVSVSHPATAQACYTESGWTEWQMEGNIIRYHKAFSENGLYQGYSIAANACVTVAGYTYTDPDQKSYAARQCRSHMLAHFNRNKGRMCR